MGEVGVHVARGDLIVVEAVGELLDGEGLPQNAGFAQEAVLEVDFDALAGELAIGVPDDGVAVEGEAGVAGGDDEGIADGL